MKKLNLLACGVLTLALFGVTACASTEVVPVEPIVNVNGVEVSSYIRTWPIGTTPEQMAKGKHWTADEVKGEYLTELIVAFAHIDPETWGIHFPDVDGTLGKFPKLWKEVAKLQAKYPHLKMNVSVGGFGADDFSPMAADVEKRAKFVASVVDLVKSKNLNGIDLDWEYPIGPDWGQTIKSDPKDGENFITLLTELRAEFDAIEAETGRYISLSVAAPAGPWYIGKVDIKKIASIVDTIKVMSYDLYGGWSATTGHASNLYTNPADPGDKLSIDTVITNYLNAGVPREKIIIGFAFYGRGWEGVEPGPKGDGLYQKYKESAYSDGLSFSDMGPFLEEGSGYTRYWDDKAKAPYLYNGDKFITYMDAEAIGYIGEYARNKKLGGVMVWEYGHDYKCELFPSLVHSVTDPALFAK